MTSTDRILSGDLVSHDQDNALGRDYIEYTETVVFGFFARYLGSGPTYAALGNHDSWPQALNSLNSLASLGEYLKDQFSWNYAHLAALWQHSGWIKEVSTIPALLVNRVLCTDDLPTRIRMRPTSSGLTTVHTLPSRLEVFESSPSTPTSSTPLTFSTTLT